MKLEGTGMDSAQDEWRPLVAALRNPQFRGLDIDCMAVGISTLGPSAVQIRKVLCVEGELHEEPRTLESHCASLIAVWNTMRAPLLLDLGGCTCVGRRLLFLEPRHGRRFAVHAVPLDDGQGLFAVLSSVSPWQHVEQAKFLAAEIAGLAHQLFTARAPAVPAAQRGDAGGLDWYMFTAREIEVLKLLSNGMSNKLIARKLGSSPNTVRNQIHSVFRKAGVSNRTELALKVAAAC